jgi:hypothetical protein
LHEYFEELRRRGTGFPFDRGRVYKSRRLGADPRGSRLLLMV